MPHRVVISYCRADQHLIRPIAKLLSGASAELEGAVYWDDSFRAGESWLTQFQRSMAESDRLFVFWCEHSSASKAVEEEIECARSTSKPIVPVLLDNTPLSPSLSPIHGIDLRPMRIHRLDPLRTLAPRLLQTIETGLRAAFAEGRWIGSIPSCLIAVLVATAWVWLGGGSVIRSVVAAATTVSKVFAYASFLLLLLWVGAPILARRWRVHSLSKSSGRSGWGEYVRLEFDRKLRQSSKPKQRTPPLVVP